MADLGATFDGIYVRNGWNGIETGSGPGSHVIPTSHVARRLVEWVAELDIRTVLDVGCGEGSWQPDLPGYVGLDVSAVAIERARRRHPSRAYRVGQWDAMHDRADLVILRDVVQHLPLVSGAALVHAIAESGSAWLLASTYADGTNVDVRAGDCFNPDMCAPPFGLDAPFRIVPDGWSYHEPGVVRDPSKFMGLWRLL